MSFTFDLKQLGSFGFENLVGLFLGGHGVVISTCKKLLRGNLLSFPFTLSKRKSACLKPLIGHLALAVVRLWPKNNSWA